MGPRRGAARPGRPRHPADGAGGQTDLARPGALFPDAPRQGRPAFHALQNPLDDPQLREGLGRPLVHSRRFARHAAGRRPPQDAPGRAAAAVERAARRHEPGGPASGTPRIHPRAGAGDSALPRSPGGASRRNRPGPGAAAARHRPRQRPPKTCLRPLLHPLSRPLARPAPRRLHRGPHGRRALPGALPAFLHAACGGSRRGLRRARRTAAPSSRRDRSRPDTLDGPDRTRRRPDADGVHL